MHDWRKTCLVGQLIRSIFRWKNCTRAVALVHFSRDKSNELTDQQDMFYYTGERLSSGDNYICQCNNVPSLVDGLSTSIFLHEIWWVLLSEPMLSNSRDSYSIKCFEMSSIKFRLFCSRSPRVTVDTCNAVKQVTMAAAKRTVVRL